MLCVLFTALISVSLRFRYLGHNNFMMEWENMFPEGFRPQAIMRTKDVAGTA